MKRLVALGLEVHITEMDVRCTGCTAARLDLQAKVYSDILQACLDNVAPTNPNGKGGCKSFETWGFTDKHTFVARASAHASGARVPSHVARRAFPIRSRSWIGTDDAPLLYDVNYQPKPA